MKRSRLLVLLKISILKELINVLPIELIKILILILSCYVIFNSISEIDQTQTIYELTMQYHTLTFNYIILFYLSFKIFYLNILKLRYRIYILNGASRNEILFSNLFTIIFYLFLSFLNTTIILVTFSLISKFDNTFDSFWVLFNSLLDSLLWTIIVIFIFSFLIKVKNKILLYIGFALMLYWTFVLNVTATMWSSLNLQNNLYSLIPFVSKNTLNYSGIFKFTNIFYFCLSISILLHLFVKNSKNYNY